MIMIMIMTTDWPGSTLRRVHNPLHNADGLAMDVFQVIFSHLIHLERWWSVKSHLQEHEGTHILQSLDGFAISLASDGR